MIIDDLDLFRAIVCPSEHNPPLIVYADRMLAGEVSPQCFQTVSWGNCEIGQHRGAIELNQLTATYSCDIRRKSLWNTPLLEDQLGECSAETPDH